MIIITISKKIVEPNMTKVLTKMTKVLTKKQFEVEKERNEGAKRSAFI